MQLMSARYDALPKSVHLASENLFESSFFFFRVFFHEHSGFTGQQGKGEVNSLTPRYHFHPFHRHLDISRAIVELTSAQS